LCPPLPARTYRSVRAGNQLSYQGIILFQYRTSFFQSGAKLRGFSERKNIFVKNLLQMVTHSNIPGPSVLGVGNALVDIMIALENDNILKQFGLPRGSMTLVNSNLSAYIYQATRSWHKNVTTGGSAANTIHTLASLGASCGYAGKISHDDLGDTFEKEFHDKGIHTHLLYSTTGTGRVMVLVSPDSERTHATCLGAAAELIPETFTPEMMKTYQYLYVEGYLVQDHGLIETILSLGHLSGLKVAIDLSSYNIVEQNRNFLEHLILNYVDIVFANEEEALAYTGKSPEEAVKIIAGQCSLAIVKTGKSGSLVQKGNDLFKIEPVSTTALDTTGAGDNYAAGFLFGLTKSLSLRQCGDIASLVSSKAVEILGAKIPESFWPELLKQVNVIERRE
jgi:sugar/nucleoside kinase (ribokinase family)